MDLIEKAAKRLENLDKKSTETEDTSTELSTKDDKSNVNPTVEKQSQDTNEPAESSTIDKLSQIEEIDYQSIKSSTPKVDPVKSTSSTDNESLETTPSVIESAQPTIDSTPEQFLNIDREALNQKGMVTPDSSRSLIKEEYRRIKRPLLVNAAGKGALKSNRANLIMVTSTNAGEGKTFSAINLAMSIAAERDKTVLLVDCDVLKPSVGRFFGFRDSKGLTDYLSDHASLEEIIVRTDVPTFRFIPAGRPHHLTNELLSSKKMEALMEELATRYPDRIIILDSPPLLSTTEAPILSSHVGQIVVVVEADNTKQDELQEAINRLALNREVAVGLVLNKSQKHMDGNYYGYGSSSGAS